MYVCSSLRSCRNFTKFSIHLTCGRGSPVLLRRQCDTLCTSGFVDDDMFSHNRTNVQNQKRRMLRRVCQVAAPGVKSAVSHCILLCLCYTWLVEKTLGTACVVCVGRAPTAASSRSPLPPKTSTPAVASATAGPGGDGGATTAARPMRRSASFDTIAGFYLAGRWPFREPSTIMGSLVNASIVLTVDKSTQVNQRFL